MAADTNGDVIVPPTLRALLSARLDQLEPTERAVLERGAVEGEVFHRGAVQAIAPDDAQVTPRLASLVRKELIRPDAPLVAGDDGFRFRHLLIRDTAYDALPKSLRADLHERFATWLEQRGTDLVEFDEILGYHYEQACRYRPSSTIPTRSQHDLAGARRHLAAGGRRAMLGVRLSRRGQPPRARRRRPSRPGMRPTARGRSRARCGSSPARARSASFPASSTRRSAGSCRRRTPPSSPCASNHAAYRLALTTGRRGPPTAGHTRRGGATCLRASADDFGLSIVFTAILWPRRYTCRPWMRTRHADRGATHGDGRRGHDRALRGEHDVRPNRRHDAGERHSRVARRDDPYIEARSVLPMRLAPCLAMLGRFDEARATARPLRRAASPSWAR